jgi:hypothetical protein
MSLVDAFYISYAYCNFSKLVIKKYRKLNFFKWQLPFLTLDINVKFNFKATFMCMAIPSRFGVISII